MDSLDFSALSDDQLVELIRAALAETLRRGPAVVDAARAAGLSEAEKARLAEEATRRASEKVRREEADRIAREAAEKVRHEAAAKAEAEKAAAELDQAARIRGLAARARELFGNDVAEFSVSIWAKGSDKRVYIGKGYNANWVEYYHTGNSRIAPGHMAIRSAITKNLSEHLRVSEDEARELVVAYCREIAEGWKAIRIEVSEHNAPRDPRSRTSWWALKAGSWYYSDKPRSNNLGDAEDSVRYTDRDAADKDRPAAAAKMDNWTADELVPVELETWNAFPSTEA